MQICSLRRPPRRHFTIRALAPTALAVVSKPVSGDTYKLGETVAVAVTFGDRVLVDTSLGTPELALTVGTATRRAAYVRGMGRHNKSPRRIAEDIWGRGTGCGRVELRQLDALADPPLQAEGHGACRRGPARPRAPLPTRGMTGTEHAAPGQANLPVPARRRTAKPVARRPAGPIMSAERGGTDCPWARWETSGVPG